MWKLFNLLFLWDLELKYFTDLETDAFIRKSNIIKNCEILEAQAVPVDTMLGFLN